MQKEKEKEMYYQFENVSVKLIDASSNADRKQRLEKPLKNFYEDVLKERHGNVNGIKN